MFIVNLNQMLDAYQKLNAQKSGIKNAMDEISRISGILDTLSGMEEVHLQLNQVKRELERGYGILQQMTEALDRILLYYSNCEQRVMDEYEQSAVHFQRQKAVLNDLNWLNQMMKELK